jgi:hypothetical protein
VGSDEGINQINEGGREMKTYKARFYGREKGAIGIFYHITAFVNGNDEHDANIKLYDTYDHITGLELEEIKEHKPLTAYRITYSDGSTSSTNMAADVTLEDAEKYFIGQWFNLGMYGIKENMQTAVKVEVIE